MSTGLAIARYVSAPSGVVISTNAPDAATCGSSRADVGVLIGAHQTSCSSKRATHSAIVREPNATSSSAMTAGALAARERASAKRSSLARSGRSIAATTPGQWRSPSSPSSQKPLSSADA